MARPVLRRANPVRRLNVTILCMAFLLSVFAARLIQLQGFESARFRAEANHQRLTTIDIPAVRGSVISGDGTVLAMTVETETVYADPLLIPAAMRLKVASKLAAPLGLPAATILNDLNHPSSPAYDVLARNVPVTAGTHIAALQEPGIDMTPSYNRVYPSGDMAANFVGFTDLNSGQTNLIGEAGLEHEYNSLLAGRAGSEQVETGTNGDPIPLTESDVNPAVPARNLRLTIQAGIQWEAERECKLRVEQDRARNCSIIVMTPTGQILAMAQWPSYNPVAPSSIAATTNINVANVFAPGSTLKPVTVAAALEKGGQTPLSAYTIPPQITMDHQFTFHDAEAHPTVRYTIAGILAHSSNVGMVQVAKHITPLQQYDYLRAFGLGSVSGLNMPGETGGILPKPGSAGYWADNPFEYSFGQGLDVTAVQMASVYATIANNGIRVQPTMVAGTTNADGTFSPAPKPPSRRVIKAKTAHELMTILQQVPVLNAQGGQRWGLIPGYPVAAKTGTAQVSAPGVGQCLCQYGSSYIGIAPADNPKLVVAVNIQDPHGKYFGVQVAGPAFYDVMKFALETMKIPPDYAKPPHIRLIAP
jgi:cell division protein FtsI (penicillin-binding protein 3)